MALNAAFEAARTVEQGQGFAVGQMGQVTQQSPALVEEPAAAAGAAWAKF